MARDYRDQIKDTVAKRNERINELRDEFDNKITVVSHEAFDEIRAIKEKHNAREDEHLKQVAAKAMLAGKGFKGSLKRFLPSKKSLVFVSSFIKGVVS